MKFSIKSFYLIGHMCALLLSSCSEPESRVEKITLSDAQSRFVFSDFGSISRHGLSNNTIPLKISLTGLVILGRQNGWISAESIDYKTILSRFGFFTPQNITGDFNLLPMGLTRNTINLLGPFMQVEGMNISCAACHAGRVYDHQGAPEENAILGIPNTNINFEGYLRAIYDGLSLYLKDTEKSQNLLLQLFPKTKLSEKIAMMVMYRIMDKRLSDLEENIKGPLPFSSGSPGVTNGVASLKFVLELLDTKKVYPEYGFTSIPSIGDRFFRTALLYDGAYVPQGRRPFESRTEWSTDDEEVLSSIVATFTMPTMGQTPENVIKRLDDVVKVNTTIIKNFNNPKYPGTINRLQSEKGFKIYSAKCASCHGSYEMQENSPVLTSFPNTFSPQADMNSDPHRWQAMSSELINKVNSLPSRAFLKAQRNEGYVAPLLTSLWITAPYLHNGSVPTLWHLLHPDKRPDQFLVGGHHIDLDKVGIALKGGQYPEGVKPLSTPELYDTRLPGRSNRGHEKEFEILGKDEKLSLIEFLKLL
tara:strand:+ start:10020 stop:11615 length:1596 start_codon:yes stop_codon:yes gene_type:complete